jgi:hypothetical protein
MLVMPGLVPGIHVFRAFSEKDVEGRSPAMTTRSKRRHYLFAFRFLAVFLFFETFFGTFFPSALASDRPMAIACLRLLTLRPDRPLFRVPALRFFIARATLADAFFEYFRAMTILPVAGK